ncbi:hypothetical protein BUZ14_06800 [Staphylococcus gallinarum]|uniref:Membrane transport protein MMPL domain-containing protein n=2 Tax=Staphylococcus gallinarum TaxID=1293 RepID=A0A3A0VN64_STAGA|nr:hypothetical protein BUZ14_06800 [Staphylococcus gallinarum]
MIAVFASFIFVEDLTIKSMGLTLAFGVLFDAFIVRMTFGPAVMSILGKASWYLPKWLDKLIPNIDIEGNDMDSLEHDSSKDSHLLNDTGSHNEGSKSIQNIKINKQTLHLYNELNNVLFDENLMFNALLNYSREKNYAVYEKFSSNFKDKISLHTETNVKENIYEYSELITLLNKQSENISSVNRMLMKIIEKNS